MCVQKPRMEGNCQECGEQATVGLHERTYCEKHFLEKWNDIGKLIAAFGGNHEGDIWQTSMAPERRRVSVA